MSDSPDPEVQRQRAEAERLLEEIRQIRFATEEHHKAVASKRQEADEHATYAFQAKNNTEAHAKAVAVYKGDAEGHANALSASKKNFDEIIATATVAKATLEADTKAAAERRKVFDQALDAVEAAMSSGMNKAEQIEKTRTEAENLVGAIQKLRDSAAAAQSQGEQARAQTEAAQSKAAQLVSQAEDLVKQLTAVNAKGADEAGEVKTILDAAKADEAELATVIKHLQECDTISVGHEKRVEELAAKLTELNQKAETLLPGATSAGLASSFLKQRQRFTGPQAQWLKVFLWCIGGLVVVALPSFINAVLGVETTADWDEIMRGMLVRLPIVVPLVWLAIYAGRNYMLSVRLEEDYAFKEAISMAFEGYKREMDKIVVGDANNPTPLTKLCLNVLSALAERPGRIYEGPHRDITPGNTARDALATNGKELRDRIIAAAPQS